MRLNPGSVSHVPKALHFLVTAHSVEADAPEVRPDCMLHRMSFLRSWLNRQTKAYVGGHEGLFPQMVEHLVIGQILDSFIPESDQN